MQFAIKCLVGMAVLASPCAWDTNPHEAAAAAAVIAKLSGQDRAPEGRALPSGDLSGARDWVATR